MHFLSCFVNYYGSNTYFLIILIILLIIFLFLFIFFKKRNDTYWTNKGVTVVHMPSSMKILIKKLRIELIEQDLIKKNGNVFGTHHFGKPTLFCADPELISRILSKDFSSFQNRRTFVATNDITDHMLIKIKDEKWKRIRSKISPTFSSGKLRKMKPIIDECVQTMLTDFNKSIDDQSSNTLNVKKIFGAFSMNAITRFAFGVKIDALTDENNPIILNARKFFAFNFSFIDVIKFIIQSKSPNLAKLLKINNLKLKECKFFYDLTKNIINARLSDKSEAKQSDFLQLLLDSMDVEPQNDFSYKECGDILSNDTITTEEIAAQCVLFFIAGFESTSTTLSYCAYNLARNHDYQEMLYNEAKSVLQSNDNIDYDLINSLKFTDAFISETLRIFPPGIFIEREASTDYILGDGIKVSKGDIIHIPIYAIHKNPENFSEPDLFKPERFFLENRTHHPYAYLPLGAGPRNCVARSLALFQIKIALLSTVYNFKFSISELTECPPKPILGPFLIPEKVFLKVEKRKN